MLLSSESEFYCGRCPPVSIYIDGSCIENRNVTADTAAGWGFVVVMGDSGVGRGTGDLIHESSGPVITDSNLVIGWVQKLDLTTQVSFQQ